MQNGIGRKNAMQGAFEELKRRLASAHVLAMPVFSPGAPLFEVICDASNIGIGAVLTQGGHAVAYESRLLNSAEQNYHPGEL